MEKYHKKLISTYAPHSTLHCRVEISDIIRDSCKTDRLDEIVENKMSIQIATEIAKRPDKTIKTKDTSNFADVYLQRFYVFSDAELTNIINAAYQDGLTAKKDELNV